MSRKGENIYKRKDKRWEARYIRGRNPDGTVKYGYCYGRSYREAKEKVAEARTERQSCERDLSVRRRFCQYCEEWLLINRDCVKESTFVKYSAVLSKYVIPKLGNSYPESLTSAVIEQFSHDLIHKAGLAPKTVKDILTVLRSVLKYTAKISPGTVSPVDIVYPKINKCEMRVLTKEEQVRFVNYLMTDPDESKFGILLALFTGMRIGEICALRWGDVSLRDRTVKVSSTMQRLCDLSHGTAAKTKIVISEPKSDNSSRLIPLTDQAVRLCESHFCDDPAAFLLSGSPDRYIEPRTLQYRLKKHTEACGIEGVHFHTLRHTFATRCVEVDFEIKSLSEILGHSSPQITLERYVHPSLELKRSNMDKLSAIGF